MCFRCCLARGPSAEERAQVAEFAEALSANGEKRFIPVHVKGNTLCGGAYRRAAPVVPISGDDRALGLNMDSEMVRRAAREHRLGNALVVAVFAPLFLEIATWPVYLPYAQLGGGGDHGSLVNSGPHNDLLNSTAVLMAAGAAVAFSSVVLPRATAGRFRAMERALACELDTVARPVPVGDVAAGAQIPMATVVTGREPAQPEEIRSLANALVSYSPQFYSFVAGKGVPLPEDNFLFALSLYFRTPVIDRTGVLTDPHVRVKVLDPLDDALLCGRGTDDLATIIRRRAGELLERAKRERRDIHVLWSGGIDSTAVLCAFFERGSCGVHIRIRYHKRAIPEYPAFFKKFRKLAPTMGHAFEEIVPTPEKPEIADFIDPEAITVTGECGDQLFGSILMQHSFTSKRFLNEKGYFYGSETLASPWEEPFCRAMVNRGLIRAEQQGALLQWLRPQLAKSPIRINSMYDFLWWMNFSLKWQHVTTRILNRFEKLSPDMVSRMEHFYRTRPFQEWALSRSNHTELKFPLTTPRNAAKARVHVWKNYKFALKQFIFLYTNDASYFVKKTKVGSLRHSPSRNFAIDANWNVISFGGYSIDRRSMESKYGNALQRFLTIRDVDNDDSIPTAAPV